MKPARQDPPPNPPLQKGGGIKNPPLQKGGRGDLKQSVKTLEKGLNLLNVLLRDFAGGFTPGELVAQTDLSNSDVTRYVNALVDAGFAERASGGRIHASHRLGRAAVGIMKSLELQQQRAAESLARISTGA